jgi:hypothetical protein
MWCFQRNGFCEDCNVKFKNGFKERFKVIGERMKTEWLRFAVLAACCFLAADTIKNRLSQPVIIAVLRGGGYNEMGHLR